MRGRAEREREREREKRREERESELYQELHDLDVEDHLEPSVMLGTFQPKKSKLWEENSVVPHRQSHSQALDRLSWALVTNL